MTHGYSITDFHRFITAVSSNLTAIRLHILSLTRISAIQIPSKKEMENNEEQ